MSDKKAGSSKNWSEFFSHYSRVGATGTFLILAALVLMIGVGGRTSRLAAIALLAGLSMLGFDWIFYNEKNGLIAKDASVKEQSGWWLFALGLFLMIFYNNWLFSLPMLAASYFLTQGRVFKKSANRVVEDWTDIDHGKWVHYFSRFFSILGYALVLISIILALMIFFKKTSSLNFNFREDLSGIRFAWSAGKSLVRQYIAALGVGLAGFCLVLVGHGINKRQLWAGVLGLCLTFLTFAGSINIAFKATGGDLTLLPSALANHAFSILISWLFFFGFYKTFFPALSEKANSLTQALEGKLKESDEALRDTRNKLINEQIKLNALFETTREGVAILDAEMNIVFYNPAFKDFFEIDSEESLNWKSLHQRLPHHHSHEKEATDTSEIEFLNEKGETKRYLSFYTREILNDSGEFVANMILVRDVTLEKEINKVKSEFVSNVSHELRTPLTSIRAYTEMLIDDESPDPETTSEYLNVILEEAERLTNLINDILDLSKMEAGKKTYRFESADPADLLKKAVQVISSEASKKGHHISLDIGQKPFKADIDKDSLYQAILNLLSNAVKFTPDAGMIDVSISPPHADGTYQIIVADNGPGISKDDQKMLFSKFFRVEDTLNREVGGTGLGLALVKQIIQVHSGQITVESAPSQGCKFVITIPCRQPQLA